MSQTDGITIYHNPRCSKSRQTLALLEERGIKPQIIPYLDQPPSAAELTQVLALLGIGPRELMRTGEDEFKAAGMDNPALSEAELVALMVANPKVIERPIVLANGKAAIGRPPEQVLDIL